MYFITINVLDVFHTGEWLKHGCSRLRRSRFPTVKGTEAIPFG